MMDIEKLIERLNTYSAEHQQHGGITAEAADALSTLQVENEKLRTAADNWKKKYVDANDKWIEAENKWAGLDKAVRNGSVYRPIQEELNLAHEENQSLKDVNEKLREELEHVKEERNAAVKQLHGLCSACKNYSPYHNKGKCRYCLYESARDKYAEVNDNWEWRGQKES